MTKAKLLKLTTLKNEKFPNNLVNDEQMTNKAPDLVRTTDE